MGKWEAADLRDGGKRKRASSDEGITQCDKERDTSTDERVYSKWEYYLYG